MLIPKKKFSTSAQIENGSPYPIIVSLFLYDDTSKNTCEKNHISPKITVSSGQKVVLEKSLKCSREPMFSGLNVSVDMFTGSKSEKSYMTWTVDFKDKLKQSLSIGKPIRWATNLGGEGVPGADLDNTFYTGFVSDGPLIESKARTVTKSSDSTVLFLHKKVLLDAEEKNVRMSDNMVQVLFQQSEVGRPRIARLYIGLPESDFSTTIEGDSFVVDGYRYILASFGNYFGTLNPFATFDGRNLNLVCSQDDCHLK